MELLRLAVASGLVGWKCQWAGIKSEYKNGNPVGNFPGKKQELKI